MSADLYHYTCDDGARLIERDGFLKPGGDGLVWLTDLYPPHREALGLTSITLKCDRMTNRFRVLSRDGILRWMFVRRMFIQMGQRDWVHSLESAPGAKPGHWFITELTVPVERAS